MKDATAIQRACQKFLEGEISLEQFKLALGDVMDIEFAINLGYRKIHYKNHDAKFEIAVEPCHVRAALEKYLHNQINETELSDWAAMLLMADEYYCPKGSTEEERNKEGDGILWKIIYQLTTPQAWEISPPIPIIRQYLAWLDEDQKDK